MNTRSLAAFVLLLVAVTACSTVAPAYRVEPTPVVGAAAPRVVVQVLSDARPDEEKTGAGAGLFNKSTKDSLYGEPVANGITTALIDELRARGVNAVSDGAAPYTLSGRVTSYRAMIVPPRTAFIPYVSYITWLWTNDRISTGVGLDLTLSGPNGIVLQKPYTVSEKTEEWVGLAGIASSARRLDQEHLVKILRAGLKNVLTQAADEVALKVK